MHSHSERSTCSWPCGTSLQPPRTHDSVQLWLLQLQQNGFPGLLPKVYFPAFFLLVDTSVDCHLSYKPLGTSTPLNTLHYLQPRCPPSLYPSKVAPSLSTATPSMLSPALIKDDKYTVLPVVDLALPDPSAPPSAMDCSLLSSQL